MTIATDSCTSDLLLSGIWIHCLEQDASVSIFNDSLGLIPLLQDKAGLRSGQDELHSHKDYNKSGDQWGEGCDNNRFHWVFSHASSC